jgi:hypothetical protein
VNEKFSASSPTTILFSQWFVPRSRNASGFGLRGAVVRLERKLGMWTISIVGVLMALLASDCLSQDRPQATGTIQGTVFTSQSDGGHAAVPHATIRLAGPATRETQSGEQGRLHF